MAVRVLTDFHHSSLLRATNMLFGGRLHMMVYRPIGLEWFEEGFWAINDNIDTAKQFLSTDQAFTPGDGTPKLNKLTIERDQVLGETQANGVYYVADPGNLTSHRACSLEWFKNNRFDYIIASIPAHVPLFKRLIELYQPHAKLIIQMGNNWNLDQYSNENILASIAPQIGGYQCDIMFYHQEFDTHIFQSRVCHPTKKISSFVNILQNSGQGWNDFVELEKLLSRFGYEFRSYGGQCRDGNMNGPLELANAMHDSQFILHSKPGGDGFGHVIFNAYACGRPVIARPSQYAGMLAEQLLVPGTFIDLDKYGRGEVKNMIIRLTHDEGALFQMGKRASDRFREVVDYEKEAEEVGQWLATLK